MEIVCTNNTRLQRLSSEDVLITLKSLNRVSKNENRLNQRFSTWGTRPLGVPEKVTGGTQNYKKTLKRSPFG
jgi:hypothetical protein